MNNGPVVFLALFVAMAGSWLAFVMGPELQIGATRPTTSIVAGMTDEIYPNAKPGAARQGAEVYRANGCVACHTQQVQPAALGPDINRGWGVRRSTAYDYLFESPLLLGTQRIGPDLANAGRRMDANSILVRLYEPRAITPRSIMPPYPYLFENHKITGIPSPDALQLPAGFTPPTGCEIIPLPEARALAAYVTSLHQDGYLYEAPPPVEKTNGPPPTAKISPAK
jgi:cytochrome c oxidase cbb3-type subunit 2